MTTCVADLEVSSNGELEEEVDMMLDVSPEAEAQALEVKARANKAFAGESSEANISIL